MSPAGDTASGSRPAPCDLDLAVGGQAVLEGVMMRSPTAVAVAVRVPDGGIVVRKRPFRSVISRLRWLNVPVLRGGIHLLETLGLGMEALMFSADRASGDERPREERGRWEKPAMWGTVAVAFVLGLGLFFYLPLVVTDLLGVKHSLWFNLVDGLIRVVLFVAYLWAIGKMPDMARVFRYHGAEHKSIHAFENGRELSADGARPFTTLHPRCGTSFLFFVMLISIGVFAFLGRPDDLGQRLLRLAFVPLIGGLAYETIKLSGRHAGSPWLRPFIWPGLMLQRITTSEPDDGMLDVSMSALRAVLEPEPAGAAERTWREGAAGMAAEPAPGGAGAVAEPALGGAARPEGRRGAGEGP